MSFSIDPADYPHLFAEQRVAWGPLTTRFQLEDCPDELVSNVSVCPYVDDEWIIIRLEDGWTIPGGTREPGESIEQTVQRELGEEAGGRLVTALQPFGHTKMTSHTDGPYKPHLPYPISYRTFGIGAFEYIGSPTNPEDGEHILEVAHFSLDEACRLLHERQPDIAELYRLAAVYRQTTNPSANV